jgi:hypothetical protein
MHGVWHNTGDSTGNHSGMNRDKFYSPTDTLDNTHTVMFLVFNVLILLNSGHFNMYVFLKVKAVQ